VKSAWQFAASITEIIWVDLASLATTQRTPTTIYC
jgi:hypothetical protein